MNNHITNWFITNDGGQDAKIRIVIDCRIEDVLPKKEVAYRDTEEECDFYYGEKDGFASYGILYDEIKKRPGHGGMWSSNTGAVYEILKKKVLEVTIAEKGGKGCLYGGAITHELAEQMITSIYEIYWTRYGCWNIRRTGQCSDAMYDKLEKQEESSFRRLR